MRVGIDIDGVLTNVGQFELDYLTKYCVENGVSYEVGERDYDPAKTFGIKEEIEDHFWSQYLEYYAIHELARPFASEVIKKLKEEGNEIYIITARTLSNRKDSIGEHMRNLVKEWLKNNEIFYDKLIFSKASNEKKVQEILDYKIDVMIEDNPNNIMELSKVVPILCYDTEYNRNCLGENITRCYSWYDIYDKLKGN